MNFEKQQDGFFINAVYALCIFAISILSGCGMPLVKTDNLLSEIQFLQKGRQATKLNVKEFQMTDSLHKGCIIGQAKTGAFNFETDIVADNPPNVIIKKAVEKGLGSIGFTMVDEPQADYIISGKVEKFWVDEHVTGLSLEYAKAYIKYDVLVTNSGGGIIWGNSPEVFETSMKSIDATEFDIPTLTRALQKSVESLLANRSFWDGLIQKKNSPIGKM